MEVWDVYDQNGNCTGRVKTRNDIFEPGEYHLGVCIWIVNPSGEFLIQKRSVTKRIRPGIWGSTGGSAIAGETSLEACIRETKEELGIQVDVCVLVKRCMIRNRIFDDYVVVCDFSIEDVVMQPDEVSEVKWVDRNEIRNLFREGIFMLDSMEDMKEVFAYVDRYIKRSDENRNGNG